VIGKRLKQPTSAKKTHRHHAWDYLAHENILAREEFRQGRWRRGGRAKDCDQPWRRKPRGLYHRVTAMRQAYIG
jgi:hypothetical protein